MLPNENKGPWVLVDRPELHRQPDRRNLPWLLDEAALRYHDRTFFTVGGRSISFSEMRARTALFAGKLKAGGIVAGDRVAIMTRNRLEYPEMLVGCMWRGAVAVPVNIAFRGMQLAHALKLTGARLLIIDSELLPALAQAHRPVDISAVWVTDEACEPSCNGYRVSPIPAGVEAELLIPIRHGEPAAIIFTSGTTGPSKGVVCPAAQFYWWAVYQSAAMVVDADSTIFNALPLFHINAINSLTQALLTGACFVTTEKFSASGFWREATGVGATHSAIVGAVSNLLLAQPPGPWDRAHTVRTVIAATMRADTWLRFSERFNVPKRVVGYGSTETNAVFNSDCGWEIPGNMGFPIEDVEADVVDGDDNPCPDGVAGELLLRSRIPFAFALGYWGMAEETVNAWRNLWFHTGDRVVRGTDGRFRFVGRLKESIRRRGENISSWEVEQALLLHPEIIEAAAFGVESEIADEEVMAAIVLRPGSTVKPGDIAEFLQPRLAKFAVPRYIEFFDALPLTETGKVRRLDLSRRGVTLATWDRFSQSQL